MRWIRAACLLLAACSDRTPPGDARPGGPSDADAGAGERSDAGFETPPRFTYFRDIKPILDGRCAQCHSAGGVGPIDLTSYEEASHWAPIVKNAVRDREMPPWHADEACADYSNDRSLGESEIAAILEWAETGAPRGDPSEEPAPIKPPPAGLSRVDTTLEIEGAHMPVGNDDYRCFAIAWPERTLKYVTGFELRPTNRKIVHHVNIYLIAPGRGDAYFRRQSADESPGYECFGGQFAEGTNLLGSWAPGSAAIEFPAGSGIQVEPGSSIVMEMHYNVAGQESPEPDRSILLLETEDQVEKRAMIAAFWNFNEWGEPNGMLIPANDPDVQHHYLFDPSPFIPRFAPWLTSDRLMIHAVSMHMHYLGTRGTLEIRRAEGTKDCLVDIPRWDFEWQTSYFLDRPRPFHVGWDQVYLECHWDNTEANQPWIAGQRNPVRDVDWGNESDDEMCIGFFYFTQE
jgi:mono/diheme cytochrome c family protein